MKKLLFIIIILVSCTTEKKVYINKPPKYITYQLQDSTGRIYFITKKNKTWQ